MAGYSGTPLAKKLGIKPGASLLCLNPPDDLDAWLAPLPAGVERLSAGDGTGPGISPGSVAVALLFTTEAAELQARMPHLIPLLQPAGSLWIGWPKKSAGVPTDLDGNRVRTIGLATGLVDTRVCAISEVWSGLRFVRRLRDRT